MALRDGGGVSVAGAEGAKGTVVGDAVTEAGWGQITRTGEGSVISPRPSGATERVRACDDHMLL